MSTGTQLRCMCSYIRIFFFTSLLYGTTLNYPASSLKGPFADSVSSYINSCAESGVCEYSMCLNPLYWKILVSYNF